MLLPAVENLAQWLKQNIETVVDSADQVKLAESIANYEQFEKLINRVSSTTITADNDELSKLLSKCINNIKVGLERLKEAQRAQAEQPQQRGLSYYCRRLECA